MEIQIYILIFPTVTQKIHMRFLSGKLKKYLDFLSKQSDKTC